MAQFPNHREYYQSNNILFYFKTTLDKTIRLTKLKKIRTGIIQTGVKSFFVLLSLSTVLNILNKWKFPHKGRLLLLPFIALIVSFNFAAWYSPQHFWHCRKLSAKSTKKRRTKQNGVWKWDVHVMIECLYPVDIIHYVNNADGIYSFRS